MASGRSNWKADKSCLSCPVVAVAIGRIRRSFQKFTAECHRPPLANAVFARRVSVTRQGFARISVQILNARTGAVRR